MNSKLLSEKALTVVDHYAHFRIGSETTNTPYYNNNHKIVRAALRATIGKGSPKDIFDEVEIMLAKQGSRGASLKNFLVDNDIGIDCSGFAYYVLSTESLARGKGALNRHLAFPFSKGIIGTLRAKFRPAENADVRTFASDKNSHTVKLGDVAPGDIITMLGDANRNAAATTTVRDHILVVTQVEYQNFIPTTIHYVNSVAWPTDGEYGHGVRDGVIVITDINKPLTSQDWTESSKIGAENYTLTRALKSTTELRRLNWF